MRESIRNLILGEKGISGSVFFLITFQVLLIILLMSVEIPRVVGNADLVLNNAVSEAVRASAYLVDEESQANRDFRIKPDEAHERYRTILAKNLKLSDATLQPMSGSPLSAAPHYVFVVFNGTNPYVDAGAIYEDGSFVGNFSGDLPQTYSISDFVIVDNNTYNRSFEISSPSCLGLISIEDKAILTNNTSRSVRYAVAEVKTRD
ncbi:MAG: hypothetical protein HPY50_02350 [Firmicutes bacterium]|nr:hypothetical protein [Bacillota bacterium]